MNGWLEKDRESFVLKRKQVDIKVRRQAFSMALLDVDFTRPEALAGEDRQKLLLRLDRLIERERLKGASGNWSYDLNRHIALKQLRDGLAKTWKSQKRSGAKRRRQL